VDRLAQSDQSFGPGAMRGAEFHVPQPRRMDYPVAPQRVGRGGRTARVRQTVAASELPTSPAEDHIRQNTALSALQLKMSDDVTLAVPASLQSITTYVLLEQERWFEKEMDFLR